MQWPLLAVDSCCNQWLLLMVALCLSFFFVVGNKNDDPERKVVLTEDAQRFAEQMKIKLFETSAKENINVEEVFFYYFWLFF